VKAGAARTITAVFTDFGAFLAALRSLKAEGVKHFRVYSPVELTEYEDLMPRRGSPIRVVSLLAGFTGCALGFWLCIGSAKLYNLIVGGKPVVAWVPYCVIGFELTILTAALCTVASVFVLSRLRPRALSPEYDGSFSADQFGICVPCNNEQAGGIAETFRSSGAVEIRES
jgi:molybdopterin-containing oxidoreductase family membrane subunit